MNKNIITVDGSTTIQEASQMMKDKGIGCVIITKDNKPTGIITERDFVTRVAAEGRPLFTEVLEVMSSPVLVIDPGETIWEAAEVMRSEKIHKLPIQEGDNIVGIVTTTDLVKLCSYGSDSQMRKICDQIITRLEK